MPGAASGVALALCLCAVTACEQRAQPSLQTAHAAESSRRRVRLVPSRLVDLSEHVSATGTLRPQEQVVVKAEVSGRVSRISVDLGTPVKRGQVIALIDPEDHRLRVDQAQAALSQARALLGLSADSADTHGELAVEQTSLVRQSQATLDEARGNFERLQTLIARKLVGRADLEAAQASLLRAESGLSAAREEIYNRQALWRQRQAELALAQRALTKSSVTSPIDGVVQQKHVSSGDLLSPGLSVATIVDIDPLRLRLEIPERAASQVELGDAVRVVAEQGDSQLGKVARMAPMFDEQNRTLAVEAEIPNPGQLRPGSFVRAEIDLGQSVSVLMVPSQAVVVFAGLEKVLTVDHGKAIEKVVATGRRHDGLTEIRSGLSAGDDVILEPNGLQSGDPVEASEESAHAEAR